MTNRRSARTADWVARYVVHEIACGRFSAGDRLPSVREAETAWGVNRLTVHKAYRQLVRQGILRSADRSGYFVAASPHLAGLSRRGEILEELDEKVAELIRRTGLSPVGTLRTLLERAEAQARLSPEQAFIECTRVHAESHASEIERRLRIPCLAFATTELTKSNVPTTVRYLVTTAFHRKDVSAFARGRRLKVVEAPIEYPIELAAGLARRQEIHFLGINKAVIELIAGDISSHFRSKRPTMSHEEVAPAELDRRLRELLGEPSDAERRFVVLSPSLWEARPPGWRTHPALIPGLPKIQERGWPSLAQALGVSL